MNNRKIAAIANLDPERITVEAVAELLTLRWWKLKRARLYCEMAVHQGKFEAFVQDGITFYKLKK